MFCVSARRALQLRRCATLVLIAMLAGCASTPAARGVMDPQIDLRAYRTFGFYETAEREYSTLTSHRLEQATREQLQRLGYRYVERNPDLLVNILLKLEDVQEARTVTTSAGRFAYRGWVANAVDTVHYREGTLAIDLVDTKRNAMVWRGVGPIAFRGARSGTPARASSRWCATCSPRCRRQVVSVTAVT